MQDIFKQGNMRQDDNIVNFFLSKEERVKFKL